MNKKHDFTFSIIRRYIVFFIIIAFSVTCCFLIFLENLQLNLGRRFTSEEITYSAKATFYNIIFLSLLLTLIDCLFYYFRTHRQLKRILDFTNQLSSGDFGKEIAVKNYIFHNEFDLISENLNRLSKELASIDGLRTEAISNISHELKTPLSVMHNYAKLLCYDDLDKAKREEYATAIYSSTEKLSSLIQSILRLSRLERQEIYRKNETFSLSNELAECIVSFDEKLENKNIALNIDMDEDITVTSDRELLDIVWNNLLSNAIKFSSPNGIIDISLKSNNKAIVVIIKDYGEGISDCDISHIFDKYYQGDSIHKKEGNGLGLAMVKRVLDILSCNIVVSSTLGEGTSFKVEIPKTQEIEAS